MEVVQRYNDDLSSRSKREDEIQKAMDLALQVAGPKNYPWDNAANVKFPLITTAALEFAGRAYGAVLPEGDWVKGTVYNKALAPQLQPVGDVLAGYMSYQLRHEMVGWEEAMDKLIHMLPVVGFVMKKVFHDGFKQQNESQVVFPQNFVINYMAQDLENTPHTQVFDLYEHEIEERIREEFYRKFDYRAAEADSAAAIGAPADEALVTQKNRMKIHGFIEQHTFLDLDQDGLAEPYIVTAHIKSMEVVRIVRRFEEDDVKRKKGGKEVIKIKPDVYFVKYAFIPSPDGSFYDIGFGTLLLPINEAVNSLINQIIDAAHSQIVGGGLIGKGVRMKGGAIKIKMGQYLFVDAAGDALANNIWNRPTPEISPVLFQTLELLIGAAQKIAAVKDLLTDENTSNMAATTAMALVEQGITGFKSIYKRLYRSLRQEYTRLARLNSRYMLPTPYVLEVQQMVPQQGGQPQVQMVPQNITIPPEAFETPGICYEPITGASSVSDMQRMSKVQFLSTLMNDPFTDQIELRKRMLKGADIENAEALITAPPPQGPSEEAQLMAAQIQVEQANAETKRLQLVKDHMKLASQRGLDRAREKLMLAQAVNQLAQAEKAETDTSLAPLGTALSHIETMTGMDNELSRDSIEAGGDTGGDGELATGSNDA